MEIKYKNYILIQDGNHFDLYKDCESIKKDTKEVYVSRKDIGYGYNLEFAITRIINEELSNKDITVDLKEYILLYKQERDEITKSLNL
ncbi:MAG: hypothetical protein M0R17_04735 [Candidatus Omnitrophica bacterium]|jgi:hypothetical protein|nr:hypothetical protein [Candidatus Omnitrophota bacterium]